MPFDKGHALLIGVGTHQFISSADVPITKDDANAVAAVLRDAALCGYRTERVNVLHDDGASKAGIFSALDTLAQAAQPGDTVFVFYAGHGEYGTDGVYYLVSHDAKASGGKVVPGTGVAEGELLEKLRAIKAERLLMVFNACHSGEISPSLGLDDVSVLNNSNLPVTTSEALLSTGKGRIIITACRAEDQKSWIGSGKLTIFAQALTDALRGKGITGRNGYISAFDLYTQVYETVKDAAERLGQMQEPELTVLRGVGPFAVSLFKGTSSLGLFDEDAPVPEVGAINAVKPERSQRLFEQVIKQSGGVNFGQGNKVDIKGDVFGGNKVMGDEIDASGSQGFINRPTGPVNQNFGTTVDTGGGAYIGGNVSAGGNVVGRDQIVNNYSTAPELSAIVSTSARALVPLLNEYFAVSDIDSLCFEMGIDDEQLRGQTKDEKARSLVKYVEQNERLDELKRMMRVARPNLRDRLK